MLNISIARAKCYLILQGLERSLAETLLRSRIPLSGSFLNAEEQARALARLREDLDDPNWVLEDVRLEDLIGYLDLGDFMNLLNRHKSSIPGLTPNHVPISTQILLDKGVVSVRKRVMHPVRPLEPDDLPILLEISPQLMQLAPSLTWSPLVESLQLVSSDDTLLDVSIPTFWRQEYAVLNNLPSAEFDDTGFIGRSADRRELMKLLESDQRVITVVGGGGKGKTALALRVCNDLLERRQSVFERVIWISLKTKYLTQEGIREISNAIDSLGALIEVLFKSVGVDEDAPTTDWGRVTRKMRELPTLLVIDNLETIGEEIRPLLLDIPHGSKVLMTSRIGLGELEVRYELPDLSPLDSVALFRSLVATYNYALLRGLPQTVAEGYCSRLGHNPLLIKWFVLAIGKGSDPDTLLSQSGHLESALAFCYGNIYSRLTSLSRQVLSVLLGVCPTNSS